MEDDKKIEIEGSIVKYNDMFMNKFKDIVDNCINSVPDRIKREYKKYENRGIAFISLFLAIKDKI